MRKPRKIQKQNQIDFAELQSMTQVGRGWRFRRVFDTTKGLIGAYGAGSGLASVVNTIAIGAGAVAGATTAVVMPAVIVPVAVMFLGYSIYQQYNMRSKQKSRWEEIFCVGGLLMRLRNSLSKYIEKGIWVDGMYDALAYFAGDTLEDKLRNIFSELYDEIENNLLVKKYEQINNRFNILNSFFDRCQNQKIDYSEEFARFLSEEVNELTEKQYNELRDKIDNFQVNNSDWFEVKRAVSLVDLSKIKYPKERAEKTWKYYLEHSILTILTAFMGAATGFGLVAGIGVLMGITVLSFTGPAFGIMVAAIVLAVVFAVLFVAIKKYIDDKEADIADALKDGGAACDKFSYKLDEAYKIIKKTGKKKEYGQEALEEKNQRLEKVKVYAEEFAPEVIEEIYPPQSEATKYHSRGSIFEKQKKPTGITGIFKRRFNFGRKKEQEEDVASSLERKRDK